MKRKLLLILLTMIFVGKLIAQNPLVKQWDYRFGGNISDYLFSIYQTKDKGFILGGYSNSGISGDKTESCWGDYDYWMVKINSAGTKQWDKRFGATGLDESFRVIQTTDGGFILGGYSSSPNNGDKSQPSWGGTDYWLIKTDSLGNKQWDKVYGSTSDDRFTELQPTHDGGFIIGGSTGAGIGGDKTQPSQGSIDYWIVKIDSLGNKQWDKDFGGIDTDWLFSLKQTKDKGYILAGWSDSDSSGDKTQNIWGVWDYWIIKIDSLGIKQWDKNFGGIDVDVLQTISQTNDDGYILFGKSASGIGGDKSQNTWGGAGDIDYWIIKVDSMGNKQWDKDFGGTDIEESDGGNISQTPDGGYLMAGTSYSNISGDKTENNLGNEQSWIVKTNSVGNKEWDKTLLTNTGNEDDELGLAIRTIDECYLMANWTVAGIGGDKTQPNWDATNATSDYWIIKFCDSTLTTSINQITNTQFLFSIYPNPTNTKLNLFVNSKENIIITNLLGEIVLRKTAEGKVELDVSFLSAGIYFIKAGNEVRKFVKE